MLGRAAYQTPWLLADVDRRVFGDPSPSPTRADVLEAMSAYADAHVASGGRLNNVTRHMLGLFHGEPGGRLFRRYIAEKRTNRWTLKPAMCYAKQVALCATRSRRCANVGRQYRPQLNRPRKFNCMTGDLPFGEIAAIFGALVVTGVVTGFSCGATRHWRRRLADARALRSLRSAVRA